MIFLSSIFSSAIRNTFLIGIIITGKQAKERVANHGIVLATLIKVYIFYVFKGLGVT
jgi:hypothetical protein